MHVQRETDDVGIQINVFLDGRSDSRLRGQLPYELEHVLLLGQVAVEQDSVQVDLEGGVIGAALAHLVLELVVEFGECDEEVDEFGEAPDNVARVYDEYLD